VIPICSAEGSAAELAHASPAPDGSLLVTVAATLPRGSSTAAEEAQYMAAVLHSDAGQVHSDVLFWVVVVETGMIGWRLPCS